MIGFLFILNIHTQETSDGDHSIDEMNDIIEVESEQQELARLRIQVQQLQLRFSIEGGSNYCSECVKRDEEIEGNQSRIRYSDDNLWILQI